MKYVYILEEYAFYDGSWILLVSEDYNHVKELFDKRKKCRDSGYGLRIKKLELNKEFEVLHDGETIDHIALYDDFVRVFVEDGVEKYIDVKLNEVQEE